MNHCRYKVVLLCLMMCFCNAINAQPDVQNLCKQTKVKSFQRTVAQKITSIPEEKHYDVLHVHLDITLNNTSVAISGNVTTTAKVVTDNFTTYVFELTTELNIDSIWINNLRASYSRNGDIVYAVPNSTFNKGDVFTARVFYGGAPSAGSVFFFQNALNNATFEKWSSPVTYTLSEPYTAKGWWPCKQSLKDKINTADIWITVADSLMAGSNGNLKKITQLPNGMKRYEWRTDYPMAYYLVSASVANYQDYSFTVPLPNRVNLPVQNFVYNRQGYLEENKKAIDSTANAILLYSKLFGVYPFYNEKYGHCLTPLFGGMEHQTMSTMGNFGSKLVSHELAHQWFGNNVTCASWQDIWLNEGFASYAEYLFAEEFWEKEHAKAYMQLMHKKVIEDTTANSSVYVPAKDTVNPYRVFHTGLSYLKPSAVIHSLRFVINNDDVFFDILKQYQIKYKDGNATTDEFKKLAEQISGVTLNDFFNQWIYGVGYPTYNLRWNQLGNDLMIVLEQKVNHPSVTPLYTMPIELKIRTNGGDTIIRIDNNQNVQEYRFTIAENVSSIEIDPNNWILNESEYSVRDFSLGLNTLTSNDIVAYPNPTSGSWYIARVEKNSEIYLTDITGKILWRATTINDYGMEVPAQQWRGMYILNIIDKSGTKRSINLIKL